MEEEEFEYQRITDVKGRSRNWGKYTKTNALVFRPSLHNKFLRRNRNSHNVATSTYAKIHFVKFRKIFIE